MLPLANGVKIFNDCLMTSTSFFLDVQIVAPTRELAMQISGECDKLIQRMDVRSMPLIGGANPARQIEKMKKNKPHIVVGTPGRLAELYEYDHSHQRSSRIVFTPRCFVRSRRCVLILALTNGLWSVLFVVTGRGSSS
mmetsp:Transcript_1140/g.3201  ORF Transcript_1140/g.3201 Transcript_1140/m.3201 type:complete len:138 (+) Transcript_1140:892-1305(+)